MHELKIIVSGPIFFPKIQERFEVLGSLSIFENMLISLENKTCIMSKNNKKTLYAINSNESASSKEAIHNPCKEISFGCGCGAASCENCPGTPGMNMGSDRDTVYRNIFSYLRIVAVILIATFIVKEALSLLPA